MIFQPATLKPSGLVARDFDEFFVGEEFALHRGFPLIVTWGFSILQVKVLVLSTAHLACPAIASTRATFLMVVRPLGLARPSLIPEALSDWLNVP